MDSEARPAPAADPDGSARSRQIALAAVAVAAAASFAAVVPGADAARVLLAVAALIAGGAAVARNPRDPKLLGLAALTALLCRFGFPAHWDSGRMASGFLTIIAASAAVLVALPQLWRRAF